MIRKLRLLSFLLLTAVSAGYAQAPVASIVATPLSGCPPLAVSFNDASTNSPTSWSWNFGAVPPTVSQATSTTKNNAVLFNTPGTYTVTLISKNASGSSAPTTVQITVNPVPTADFTEDKTTGCYPTTIHFTDQSKPNGSPIVSWTWDYGDGTLDPNTQNPSHIYQTAGSFPVTLYVKNSFNCTGSAQVKNVTHAITISNGVVPNFSSSLNSSCQLPVTATFTNSSSGPPVINYLWDFGDGSPTSNTFSPTHNYLAAGNYTVVLAATSTQGCTDTLRSPVSISASGSLSDFTGSGSVCLNTPVNFNNTSSPFPNSSTWDYGDGSPLDNTRNGLHTYTSTGTFNVTLTNNFSGCNGTVTKPVTVVNPPTTAFTATNVSSCSAPLTTNFTDQTVGATSWSWNFGDGSPISNLQNPVHTYNSYGSFQVTLTASSAGGCSSVLTKNAFINIAKPVVSITNTPAYGCAPFVYTPTISATAVDGIASYSWNFGNGFVFNGQNPPPQTYAAGVFNVSLTITSNGGCQAKANGVVKVGLTQPTTLFTAVPTSACVGQSIQFTDQSTGGANQWAWDFGDGSTSTIQSPSYSYTKPGTYDVTLTAYNNGCSQKLTKTAFITVNPPLADFNYSFACGAKDNYTFTDNSIGAATWDWDFGDLSPHYTAGPNPPVHIYPGGPPAVYNVTLKVTNGGCSNTITKQISVNQVTTVSTSANPVCNNTLITIFATSPANIVSYSFDFGDGSPIAGSGSGATSHTYTKPGDYIISVTTTDINGCTDVAPPYTMHISGPTVKFTTPTQLSCGPLTATFTDQSTAAPGTSLKTWSWDFGDGGTSAIENPTHNYTFQGLFPVKLIVTDNNGCSDSLINPNYITISTPVAGYTTTGVNFCPTSNIHFTNTSTGGFNPTYSWDFGDGNPPVIATSPVYTYPAVGTYTVKLTMKDSYGCSSTYSNPVPINIAVPVASFNMSGNYSACPPFQVNFTFTGSYAQTYLWNFDDAGASSTGQNSTHLYANPGDYFPTLTIVSPGGCVATAPAQHIHIDGPIGAFSYSPLSACNAVDVNFQVTTSNVVSFVWNFGDGTPQQTTGSPTNTHHYGVPGQYTPFVILQDASGCNVTKLGINPIEVDAITQTSFTTDKSVLCDKGTINFTSTSTVAIGTVINNYSWDFGDGSPVVNGMNPTYSYFYSTPGLYNATLTISTVGGCTGSYSIPVTIAASPQVAVNGIISQCEPAVLTFSGTELVPDPYGPLTWSWDFGNGQKASGQNPAPVSYPKAGEYVVQLIATNTKGCSDTTDTSPPQHLFIYPIPSVNAGADTTICLGTPLQLNASGVATTYNWLPPVNGTLSCLNCVNPIANTPVSTYFVVNGSSPQGCQANDTIQVTVNTPVTVNVNGPDSVCLGQSVQLTASGAALYTWTPSEGLNNPNIANPLAKPDATQIGNAPSAVINYQVTGTDNKKCFSDTKSVNVTAFNNPVLNLGPNATINVGNSYQINATASTNVVSLNWTPSNTLSCSSCLTPIATPVKTTNYLLTAVNDGGCARTDSIRIQVVCNGANFFVPNTFSPNGDGVNDHFIINGVGLNVIPSITIYNRWGQIVFQKSNFTPNTVADAWDGTFNGQPAPSDVYVYTIQILCDNATLIPYHGNVTLIR